MDVKQRIVLGAIGGITPYLVTLLTINFKSAVSGYEVLDWVGLAIRCFVLIFLGSFVAYLHKSEREPFKVFQLGVAAPALLAAFINGNQGSNQVVPTSVGNTDDAPAAASAPLAVRGSGEGSVVNEGMIREPNISNVSRLMRGVFGTKLVGRDGSYFVTVGNYKDYEKAIAQAKLIERRGYQTQIYQARSDSKAYSVAIASNISKTDAAKLRDKAVQDGLPAEVWTY